MARPGTSGTGSWWVTSKGVVQSATNPGGGAKGPFNSKSQADAYVAAHKEKKPLGGIGSGTGQAASNALGGWITGLGGEIGSGLEGGVVAILKDLWDVILGPLEIVAGIILAIIMLLYIFKDDLLALAPLIAAGV